jgi:hypothetical protein
VHCALPDATAAPPVVDFKDGQIGIRHLGMTWRVQVDDPATTSDPARPLLTLKR